MRVCRGLFCMCVDFFCMCVVSFCVCNHVIFACVLRSRLHECWVFFLRVSGDLFCVHIGASFACALRVFFVCLISIFCACVEVHVWRPFLRVCRDILFCARAEISFACVWMPFLHVCCEFLFVIMSFLCVLRS